MLRACCAITSVAGLAVAIWLRRKARNTSSSADPCICAGGVVKDDAAYKEAGEMITQGGLDMYVVKGSPTSATAIVIGADIFGMSSALKRNADVLAKQMACTVVMPDHFRGHFGACAGCPLETISPDRSTLQSCPSPLQHPNKSATARGWH